MVSMFLPKDQTLGKKDDDRKPTKVPPTRSPWTAATGAPKRKILKRLAAAAALAVLVYLFIANLPTDVPIRDRRRPVFHPNPDADKPPASRPMPKLQPDRKPQRPLPPYSSPDNAPPPAGYNGPLKFEKLLSSLQAIYSTGGVSPVNKNVLFAAASLQSAALLLPMACQMGIELRNYVHFALVGGSDISLEKLRAVNGIGDACHLIFHDARPDFATTSATERLKQSSARALYHINKYMHPQVLIVDDSGLEEDYFLTSIRKQAPTSGIPLIELPEHAPSRLAWITKLDSSSLAAWDKISVDILIQAPPSTSGSLIRLLKSLSVADFAAGSTPHLTIELPHDLDKAAAEFLKTFQWPPSRYHLPSNTRQLTFRHRIPHGRLTEEESSVRFLESFWPTNPKYSHVLVLSPQAQVSSQFFQYVKYAVLHYLYSGPAVTQEWDSRLLGISLELPSTHLDGSKPFTPPSSSSNKRTPETDTDTDNPPTFLWQAPNSNAALFTGQKWTELHALVSHQLRLQASRSTSKAQQQQPPPLPPFFTNKLVSKKHPSWLEHALRLSRARGYWTLYPGPALAANLATVHAELYRAPEEYEAELPRGEGGGGTSGAEAADTPPPVPGGTLIDSLPGRGRLMAFGEMPLLAWDGRVVALEGLDVEAAGYAGEWRRAVGGCESLESEGVRELSGAGGRGQSVVGDLFCLREGEE